MLAWGWPHTPNCTVDVHIKHWEKPSISSQRSRKGSQRPDSLILISVFPFSLLALPRGQLQSCSCSGNRGEGCHPNLPLSRGSGKWAPGSKDVGGNHHLFPLLFPLPFGSTGGPNHTEVHGHFSVKNHLPGQRLKDRELLENVRSMWGKSCKKDSVPEGGRSPIPVYDPTQVPGSPQVEYIRNRPKAELQSPPKPRQSLTPEWSHWLPAKRSLTPQHSKYPEYNTQRTRKTRSTVKGKDDHQVQAPGRQTSGAITCVKAAVVTTIPERGRGEHSWVGQWKFSAKKCKL